MTMDEKNKLHNKTIDRLLKLGIDVTSSVDVIAALTDEIDCYRTKINEMQNALDNKCDKIADLEHLVNRMYGECIKIQPTTQLEAVQQSTITEIINALSNNGYNTITINCYKDNESEV